MPLAARVSQNTHLNYCKLPTDDSLLHTTLSFIPLLPQRFVSTFSLFCLQGLILLFHFAVPKLTTSWCFSIVNSIGRGREHKAWQPKSSRPPHFERCIYVQGCSLPVQKKWFLKWCAVSPLSGSNQLHSRPHLLLFWFVFQMQGDDCSCTPVVHEIPLFLLSMQSLQQRKIHAPSLPVQDRGIIWH